MIQEQENTPTNQENAEWKQVGNYADGIIWASGNKIKIAFLDGHEFHFLAKPEATGRPVDVNPPAAGIQTPE
jgi:thiamine biosynthesis lipoprotein ApbE